MTSRLGGKLQILTDDYLEFTTMAFYFVFDLCKLNRLVSCTVISFPRPEMRYAANDENDNDRDVNDEIRSMCTAAREWVNDARLDGYVLYGRVAIAPLPLRASRIRRQRLPIALFISIALYNNNNKDGGNNYK